MTETNRLLTVENLRVDLPVARGAVPRTVIHDVSLTIDEGQAVGLVGESGSGKSMTTRAIMRLLPKGSSASGDLQFRGESVRDMDRRRLASYRAGQVSMIYQDPRAHTNPLNTVGEFLIEGVVASGLATRTEAVEAAVQLLAEVGIADGARRMKQYPHQLSGGLLQRMMIVMALLPSPQLILADEPTTALDVTVQSEVMAILDEQRRDRRLGMLFITHDLDLAAAISDDLAVMYAGVIVERGSSDEVYATPRHPYTAGLLGSRPSTVSKRRLVTIPGRPVSAFEAGQGCVFASRCAFATDACRQERPDLRQVDGRWVACHRAEEIGSDLVQGEVA